LDLFSFDPEKNNLTSPRRHFHYYLFVFHQPHHFPSPLARWCMQLMETNCLRALDPPRCDAAVSLKLSESDFFGGWTPFIIVRPQFLSLPFAINNHAELHTVTTTTTKGKKKNI